MADQTRPLAWITGAGGLIGNYIAQTAACFSPNWRTLPLTRDVVDLTDFSAVRALWHQQQPQLVFHCAAISKSPACQENPKLAWKVNVDVTEMLADLAADAGFIFVSTDLVFDGQKGNYSESDEPHPLSVYGETKVAAEKVVLRNSRHSVVRTSLNAGRSPTGDRSFTEETRNAWRQGKCLKLFVDEFRSPIPAAATARALWELAGSGRTGLFHLAGAERLSRYAVGEILAGVWPELNPQFEASSLRDYSGAPRPPDTSLDCRKIQGLLSFQLPGFSGWARSEAADLR